MDDYIYILLAIAWIAFTIYSQKQKKKKQQQQAKPQQQTQKDIKSYFEEILLGNVSSPDPIITEPVIEEEIYESVSGYKTSENLQPEYEFLEEGSQLSEEYFDQNSAIEKPEIQIEEKPEIVRLPGHLFLPCSFYWRLYKTGLQLPRPERRPGFRWRTGSRCFGR